MIEIRRADRVGDVIRVEIADILSRRIKDPRIGFVTVTAVEVSDDLRYARVFVSVYEEAFQEKTLEGLSSASGFIRGELGKRLRLRFVPELSFRLDRSLRDASRVTETIEGITKEGR